MKNLNYIWTISIAIAFLLGGLACSISRKVNFDRDARDDTANDAGDDYDDGTNPEAGTGGDVKITRPDDDGDNGKSGPVATAGVTGNGVGPDQIYCSDEGWCYHADGTVCDPEGYCCDIDDDDCWQTAGYDSAQDIPVPIGGYSGGVAVGGSTAPISPLPPTGSRGGTFTGSYGGPFVNPEDFTDEPWDPLENALGDLGWKESDEPLCSTTQRIDGHAVWSDSRGVFALVFDEPEYGFNWQWDEERRANVCVGDKCPSYTIFLNDGTGWEVFYKDNSAVVDSSYLLLTGFEGGSLITYGWEEGADSACGLAMIDNGTKRCEPVYSLEQVFVVNDNLAYGIHEGYIVYYNGNSWGPLPTFPPDGPMNRLWANETHLFTTVDGDGKVAIFHDGRWSVHQTPASTTLDSIWGFSETDVWAGSRDKGLYHFDGDAWTQIEWDADDCKRAEGIKGMWGDNGTLYFTTPTQIARVTGTEVEVLNSGPCGDHEYDFYISALWGNSPNEVFFSIIDESYPRRECGVAYVLWFDGTVFHQM